MLYIKASPDDVLGDEWAGKVGRIWERMKKIDEGGAQALERSQYRWSDGLCSSRVTRVTEKDGAYEVWQWMQCRAAGMESRIVASPQAMVWANRTIPDQDTIAEIINLSDRALLQQKEEWQEEWQAAQKAWNWGGIPFYEIPLGAGEFTEHREVLRKDNERLHKTLSLTKVNWNAFLADCAKHILGIRRGTQKDLIRLARDRFCTPV